MEHDVREALRAAAGTPRVADGFETIWRRSLQLRRRRIAAFTVIATAFTAAIAAAVILLPGADVRPNEENVLPALGPSNEESRKEGYFYPETSEQGSLTAVSVTFPDGTHAEILYPPDLGLAGLGVRPHAAATMEFEQGCGSKDFRIFYDYEGFYDNDGSPLATYEGADGGVVELRAAHQDDPAEFILVFHFDSWVLGISDEAGCTMSEEERAMWARSLRGGEAKDGFLILDVSAPAKLSQSGEHMPPTLEFGSDEPQALIFPGSCAAYHSDDVRIVEGKPVYRTTGFADWCLPEAAMRIHAKGSEAFVDEAFRKLEVRRISSP